MIVDLVRNDLRGSACRAPSRCRAARAERTRASCTWSPRSRGRLRAGIGWPELLAATVRRVGVRRTEVDSALPAIRDLEPVPRGPYCGASAGSTATGGELAVGIRSFWWAPEGGGC